MHERIKQLAQEAGMYVDLNGNPWPKWMSAEECEVAYKKFANLIVAECDRLNRKQSFELTGVVVDVEQGDGFDSVCLDTVKRVESYLADSTLKKHFGVEK